MEPVVRLAEKISWFPGHMYKATKGVKENIKNIDVFLEIRDARVPYSSRNHELDAIIKEHNKPKIILFNKFDQCNQGQTLKVISDFNKAKIECMALSAQAGTNIPKILQKVKELRPAKYNTVGMWMMVGGMPNVGKSTILNTLRNISKTPETKKNIVKTGPLPCVTRGVSGFKVSEDPVMFVVDTPGIMVPRITDEETGLKLSIVGCIKDTIVGKDILIDYLLEKLNERKAYSYVKFYDLPGPINRGHDLIEYVKDKYKHQNYEATYDMILGNYRHGKIGRITLDDVNMSA